MVRDKTRIIRILVYSWDLFLTSVSFFLAYWLRDTFLSTFFGPLLPLDSYLQVLLVILPTWSSCLFLFGAYRPFRTETYWVDIRKIIKAVLFGILITVAILFLLKARHISRTFIAVFALVNLCLLITNRLSIRLIASFVRSRNLNTRSVAIVGTGEDALECAHLISDRKRWGLVLVGLVSVSGNKKQGEFVNGYRVMGSVSEMDRIIKDHVLDEVIIAVSRDNLKEIDKILEKCEEAGITTRIVMNLFSYTLSKVHLGHLQGIPLLSFTTVPQSEVMLAFKRAFDIAVSASILIISGPLLLILSVLIKTTSPGPVFFRQERVGKNGRRFTLLKFRSMVDGADAQKQSLAHLNEMDGPVFKIPDDPRVTGLGKFLRRTSLDEFPQFINVLKGDMSIVGPRPPIPEEVRNYDRWQRRRLSMKPGITCLWQISGRNETSFDDWMDLDLKYIDNWSLGLDLKIFVKTIPTVVFGRGAY